MSYRLNKTNGDLVVELADGQIDTVSTDITLVGRNYRGFGELFNENFIKIVENFANTAAPNSPLKGQLWYDTNEQRLKIYNGNEFRTAGSPIVSSSRPSLVTGDLWIDSRERKLYFYDGNQDGEITLVGPDYSEAQGKTGIEVESVIDIGSQEQVIIKFLIAGELFAVLTREDFRLSGSNKIDGYPDDPNDVAFPRRQLFKQGFNIADSDYFFRGSAESARALVDAEGNALSTADFLPTSSNGTTTGTLTIKNSNGLSIGIGDVIYSRYRVIGNTTVIDAEQKLTDLALRTRTGNAFSTPFYANSSESRVGIFNTEPEYTLDVNGDFRSTGNATIDGNLTVNGNATYVNVDTLRVLDKNIELGMLDDSTEGNDNAVDDAGITVRSFDGNKEWYWSLDTNSWTSNVNLDLELGNEYKINGDRVLTRTELGSTVKTASGITKLGKLDDLEIDELNFDSNRIFTDTGENLILDASGDVSLSNSKIQNLGNPTDNQDATTKSYVDELIRKQPVAFALDITGLDQPTVDNPYNDVRDILEEISPAANKENGVEARIHVYAFTNVSVSDIDVQSAMDKTTVTIDNTNVVQDVNFSPASGTFDGIPTRQRMRFEVVNGSWNWQNTVELPQYS